MSEFVEVGIASSLNASFNHRLSTGYTREEWDGLDEEAQDEIAMELAWQWIDVWVVEDE